MNRPESNALERLSQEASLTHPSEVRHLLEALGVRPRRTWGQNFLIDGNIRSLLLEAAGLTPGERVLEVGPGLGMLTEAILEAGSTLVAIEKDPVLCRHLRVRFADAEGFTLVEGDVLEQQDAGFALGPFDVVLANLPYGVGSRFLVEAFLAVAPPSRMVVTVQKEVGDRLCASPGGKDYGLLGVMAQLRYDARCVKRVGPRCFWPVPEIDSSVIALTLRASAPGPELVRAAHLLVREAFAHRRKQLLALFSSRKGASREAVRDWLVAAGRQPDERPEAVAPEGWLRLAETSSGA